MEPGNDKHRLLIKNLPDAFACHQVVKNSEGKPVDYIFLEVNQAFKEMTGLPRDKIIGKKVQEVHPGIETLNFDWIGTYDQLALTGESIRFEQYLEIAGSWYDITAYSDEPGYFVTVFRDITESKKTEQTLRESESRYRNLVENINEVIYILDENANITYVSPSVELISGYTPSELAQMRFTDFVHPDDLEGRIEQFFKVMSGVNEVSEYRFITKDGRTAWVKTAARPVVKEGRVAGVQGVLTDITERKQAELALVEKEKQQELLLDNTETQVWYLNDVETYGSANQAHADFLGVKKETLQNKSLYELMANREEADTCIAGNQEVFTNKQKVCSEEWVLNGKGELRLLSISKMPKLDHNGNVEYVVCSAEDITERKEVEEELLEERAFRDILLGIAVGFINVPLAEFDSAINDMLRKTGEFTNVDRTYLFLHDHLRRVTTNTHEWCRAGITPEIDNLQDTPFDFFSDMLKTWEKGEIVHIPSVTRMPEEHAMRSIFLEQGIQSLVLIPLMQNQVNIGFVGFDAVNKCKSFSDQEIALLRVLAEIISNAFGRKEGEEELARAKKQTDHFFNQSLHGFFFCMLDEPIAWNDEDADKNKLLEYTLDHQRMTRVNQAMLDQYGAKEEDFIGITVRELFQHDLDHAREIWRGLFDRGNWHIETFEKRMDGTPVIIDGDYICLYDDQGRITGHFGVQADITEQKAAAEALKASEQKYREILSAMEEGYYEVDLAGNFVFFNESLCRLLGYSGDELMGESYKRIYKNHEEVFNTYNRVYQTGRPEIASDWPVITRDGREIYGEVSISLRRNERGKPIGFRGVARDITQRKEAEERIRYLSFHDQLTGLYNRHFMEEEMNRLDTARQLPLSLIMADLNGLKLINDTYGHEVGDKFLKDCAAIIKDICRKEDIIARWGGDEFVILLPQTREEEAWSLCHRIGKACDNTCVEDVPLSMALGAAAKSDMEKDMKATLKEAEDNMYKQKLADIRSHKSNILKALLKTLEEKSYETEVHTQGMRKVAKNIGKKMNLTDTELSRLDLLITLHDIGKINIPEEILTKEGPLTATEWEVIKEHPEIGFRITRATEEFAHVAEDILAHHEHWDGSGYPRGLKGENIPLLARITAIADAFEVMSRGRPYNGALQLDEIKDEFKRYAGTQFDPQLVEVLLSILETDKNIFLRLSIE